MDKQDYGNPRPGMAMIVDSTEGRTGAVVSVHGKLRSECEALPDGRG